MKTLFVVVPLLVGMLILLYTIVANLLRIWLAHNVKMALLERLQHGDEEQATPEEIQALLELSPEDKDYSQKLDYIVVGTVLLLIGVVSALAGYLWGQGSTSAAVYFGGVVCGVVGAILILLGLLIRYLTRLPIAGNPQ